MATNEKFQAGHAYSDDKKAQKTSLLEDPATIATELFTDLVGAGSAATFTELLNLVKSLLNEGEPADDRKGNTETLIKVLSALPNTSHRRTQLTHKLIDTLWSDLQHPPLTYVGGGIKYDVASNKKTSVDAEHDEYDTIEFEVPGTGIQLREEVPKAPNGMHNYRMPDGSFNNIMEPSLGKAGSPYAKSVKSSKTLHGVRPDAGQLFDLLMARGDNDFRENPAGISSMLFYHASIIIHDIFRTSRTDMNKSDTSSYLDLAPLYGSSLRDQLKVRTMKGGKLKPDTFHEKRLLGQPAGVNVMLVLYSRFHNYVCDILLSINEGGRFTLATPKSDANPEDLAKALAKQDHDLFNTARLIVGGLYVSISLGDYLRAIMNLHSVNTEWCMDPRTEIGKQYDGEGVPRGVGNMVSVEFNLLYRFHSCISKKDERWTNDFLLKLLPDKKAEDLDKITLPELGAAFVAYEKSIPTEPCERTFGDLKRGPDGRFKDEDLVRILKEAMEDPAGTFGSNMVPKALKIIEIQGINQSRRWGCASLNEFREFFGLKRYEKFTDINSDEYIAKVLEQLYQHPDMVEMYPGMMIEDIKAARNPGVGVCPTYTVGRAVLADAVTLVRSDRFLTLDYSVSNLTAWGMNEISGDAKVLGKSMLYKLIQRGLPGWFPYNSITVMQPMYTKKANIEIAKRLGTFELYTLNDPSPPRMPVSVTAPKAIKEVLNNPQRFIQAIDKGAGRKFYGNRNIDWYMLLDDKDVNKKDRAMATEALKKAFPNLQQTIYEFLARAGAELINKEAFEFKNGMHQIDVLRDFAIPLSAQLVADTFYLDLRTDENPTGVLSTAELYRALINTRVWVGHNTDSAESWQRRRRAIDSSQVLINTTRKLVDEVIVSRGLGWGLSAAISQKLTRQATLRKGSLRSCGFKFVDALLAQKMSPENVTDELWLNAFGGIGVLVARFHDILKFFLKPGNESIWSEIQDLAIKSDLDTLQKYVAEANRLTANLKIVRIATQATELEGKPIQAGSLMVLHIGAAARDADEVPDADKFDPNRQQPDVNTFGFGQHSCFGQVVAMTFLTGLVGLVAGLKNLRPAPGAAGSVKQIDVRFETMYLNDSWSYLAHYPSNWKLQFDGIGKGIYENNTKPQDVISMQEYYAMLEKLKQKSN